MRLLRRLWWLILALLSAAPMLASDFRLYAGPSVTGSDGLGYKSPYAGAVVYGRVGGDATRAAFVFEGGAYDARKVEGSHGYGLSLRALGRFAVTNRLYLLGGLRGWRQHEAAYDKTDWEPEVGAMWVGRQIAVGLLYDFRSSAREHQRSIGARAQFGGRPLFLLTFERVSFDGAKTGSRAEVSMCFPLVN